MMYNGAPKRLLDLAMGIAALAIAIIPLTFAIVAVKLNPPGPAFFFQTRVGKDEKPFRIFKLRTMVVDTDREITAQVKEKTPGVFAVGAFLRRFKIDEMPQILNVIKGDMSFIGPRPCLQLTADEMPQWARRRFEVRPGITGLAQANGNTRLSWEKRWWLDIQYIDRLSFSIDIWLLLKTVFVLILGEDKFGKMV